MARWHDEHEDEKVIVRIVAIVLIVMSVRKRRGPPANVHTRSYRRIPETLPGRPIDSPDTTSSTRRFC